MLEVSREYRRERIGCLNWPEAFPYAPSAAFGISCDGEVLHLHFIVEEAAVRAVCAADGDPVWEDSCVEFFFAPHGDGRYYNLECSCTGKILLCVGTERQGRERLPDALLQTTRRHASLGDIPFGLRQGPLRWELRLEVPAAVFGLETYDGLEARGNFYKCGDRLPVPHYLSWAPVRTPRPDFHRPEFFDRIVFV